MSVVVSESDPPMPPPDYIRLWASYFSKIVYVLGYPNELSANMAIFTAAKIVEEDLNENTQCFVRAELLDVVDVDTEGRGYEQTMTGEFYGKGIWDRRIKTWFPHDITEQQIVFTEIALLQYCIRQISNDKPSLSVLTSTARNMVGLYSAGKGKGVSSIVRVPQIAFLLAAGARDPDTIV